MTTKIKWRLSKLPDSQEVSLLVKEGILTKEEAREILISHESEEDRDKKSLQDEIKFLRELVQKLSTNSQIVQQIGYIQQPYQRYEWYQPYMVYCNSDTANQTGTLTYSATAGTNVLYTGATGTNTPDFTNIKTF